MARVLIVACGNPMRGDDGAAWQAAERLRQTLPASLAEILTFHQFMPELADVVSHADAVIFLDAAAKGTPGEVVCEPVGAAAGDSHFSHHLAPSGVLALAEQLYGACPKAYVVSLCGECFEHGEKLSPVVFAAMPKFVRTVDQLVCELGRNSLASK